MNKENIAVLIMLGTFIAWLTFIYLLKNEKKPERGFLESISEVVKVLKGPWVALFSIWCIVQVAPLAVFLETSGWFFMPMVCMGLLAATPLLPKIKQDALIKHIIGASGAILSSYFVLTLVYNQWWWILALGVAALLLARLTIKKSYYYSDGKYNAIFAFFRKVNNYTTYLEIAAFLFIILGLIIR